MPSETTINQVSKLVMKKMAIFVEGQTEQFFVSKLLQEVAGRKNISVTLYQLRGCTIGCTGQAY